VILPVRGKPVAKKYASIWIEGDDEHITAIHALRHPGKLARLAATVTNPRAGTSLH